MNSQKGFCWLRKRTDDIFAMVIGYWVWEIFDLVVVRDGMMDDREREKEREMTSHIICLLESHRQT